MFALIGFIIIHLDILNFEKYFKLIAVTPLFLVTYGFLTFPVVIVLTAIDVNIDIYWDIAIYYSLVIKIILIVLILGYLISTKHRKEFFLHYTLTVLRHNYFSVFFVTMVSVEKLIKHKNETIDYVLI
jgi:energy-converting hydrogenase Eha subunit C